jgi:drug/metabolite transporter (DMT)-like permease
VSPIIAADAAFGVLLFVVFLHESLSANAVAAVIITIVGVVLASFDPRGLARRRGGTGTGIPFAFVSLVFFTLGLFAAGAYSKRFGWFLPTFTSRVGTMAVILSWLAVSRAKGLDAKVPARPLAMAGLIGAADLGGFALFTRGSELGLASIVTAASATFPLIPIVGGMVLFHERPAASQLVGAGLVIAGLVVLGLAS